MTYCWICLVYDSKEILGEFMYKGNSFCKKHMVQQQRFDRDAWAEHHRRMEYFSKHGIWPHETKGEIPNAKV